STGTSACREPPAQAEPEAAASASQPSTRKGCISTTVAQAAPLARAGLAAYITLLLSPHAQQIVVRFSQPEHLVEAQRVAFEVARNLRQIVQDSSPGGVSHQALNPGDGDQPAA